MRFSHPYQFDEFHLTKNLSKMPATSPPIIGLHLDLKYVMPRKDYLLRWLREISSLGINTLLLEYEDKFPYEKYPFLRAPDAFTPEELRTFLDAARECGLEVIPLVQTLSHLEFALAHEELAHLREAPDILTQINPSHPDALQLVHNLIDEVLAYHVEDKYFHLGADETWFVGTDPGYANEVKTMGLPAFWARHLRPYLDQVMGAGKRPIVWDDVLWNEPSLIETLGLPRELILLSWDYFAGTADGADEALSRVDVYTAAGHDVLGAPCLNWGVLTPRHDHVVQNTAAWARKTKESSLQGLINTSWAVFHTPLATQMPYVGATAELLKDTSSPDWLIRWMNDYFGVTDAGFEDALRDLSVNWEQKIPGLGRALTPVVYGYMDMILHFGSQDNRMKAGCYPLDWGDVDFVSLYRQKLTLLRKLQDRTKIENRLHELGATYARAANFFRDFAGRVSLHHEEARLLSCFAELKCLHVSALKLLILAEGDAEPLCERFEYLGPVLEGSLSPFYERPGARRLMTIWWEPAFSVLKMENSQTPDGENP